MVAARKSLLSVWTTTCAGRADTGVLLPQDARELGLLWLP